MSGRTIVEVADRRTFRRIPVVCNVWQRGGASGSRMAGRTLNLSDGGALIQLTALPEEQCERPRCGQSVELTLAVPRGTVDTFLMEHIQIDAEVVRIASPGEGQPPATLAVRFGQPVRLQLD